LHERLKFSYEIVRQIRWPNIFGRASTKHFPLWIAFIYALN
jgi:hypothetical protein